MCWTWCALQKDVLLNEETGDPPGRPIPWNGAYDIWLCPLQHGLTSSGLDLPWSYVPEAAVLLRRLSAGFITSGLRQLDILQPSAGPAPGGSSACEPQFPALPDLGLAGAELMQAQPVPWPALSLLKQHSTNADPCSGNHGSPCSACACRSTKAQGGPRTMELLCLGPSSRHGVACCQDTARGWWALQSSPFASSHCLMAHWMVSVLSLGHPTQPPLLLPSPAACSHTFPSTFSKGPESSPMLSRSDLHWIDPILVAGLYKSLATAGFPCTVQERKPGDPICAPQLQHKLELVCDTFWPPISTYLA